MGGVTETGANSPFECTCSGRSTEKFRSDTLSCDSSIAAISVSIWAFLMAPSFPVNAFEESLRHDQLEARGQAGADLRLFLMREHLDDPVHGLGGVGRVQRG